MPWILCGPGHAAGEHRRGRRLDRDDQRLGLRSFSTWPTPVIVPPVPTPATKASTSPSVSRQISSAVVRRWISGLAGLENCCGMKPLRCSQISSASSTASVMPPSEGVSRTSAP